MNRAKKIIEEMLDMLGITVNGSAPYDIKINNEQFYHRVLSKTALGLGESYMDGWWDCEASWPELKEKYGERFRLMWRYYLLSSAAGFRSRQTQLWQIVMTRRDDTQPNCRVI